MLSDNADDKLSLVDWSAGKLLPAPRKNRPDQRETRYPVKCANPYCNHIRWLTAHAATKAEEEQRICRKCQSSNAGRLGYEATVALYGEDFALKAVKKQQLHYPSRYEARMDHWLFEMRATYQRQFEFIATDAEGGKHGFLIDFLLDTPQGPLPLEVNGFMHQTYRTTRDWWLDALWPGLPVVFITTDEMDADPDGVKARLRQLLTLPTP